MVLADPAWVLSEKRGRRASGGEAKVVLVSACAGRSRGSSGSLGGRPIWVCWAWVWTPERFDSPDALDSTLSRCAGAGAQGDVPSKHGPEKLQATRMVSWGTGSSQLTSLRPEAQCVERGGRLDARLSSGKG